MKMPVKKLHKFTVAQNLYLVGIVKGAFFLSLHVYINEWRFEMWHYQHNISQGGAAFWSAELTRPRRNVPVLYGALRRSAVCRTHTSKVPWSDSPCCGLSEVFLAL